MQTFDNILRWLFGVRQSPEWTKGGDWHLELAALPQGAWAAVAVGLAVLSCVVVWWLYRLEGRTIGRFARTFLAATRLATLALIAVMLMEAVLVITKHESIASRMLVLVDTSQSMGLADPYSDEKAAGQIVQSLGLGAADKSAAERLRKTNRLQLAKDALEPVLKPLAQGREVYVYDFGAKLNPPQKQPSTRKLKPAGDQTALGTAIASALAAHRGHPIAGILIASDAQSNAGEDARRVAAEAASAGVVVHSLAMGTDQGPSNARIADVEVSPVVFVRDPSELVVLLESHGLQGRSAALTVEQRRDGGVWTQLGREEVTIGEDGAIQRVPFKFNPDQPGTYDFRARLSDVGQELTEADNTLAKSVKAIRSKIRTLLIAGSPSPEVQFLRNALLRDEGVEFASWIQSADQNYEQLGHRPIRRLPATQRELQQYDVVILFDPDMKQLGSIWPELLTHFVGDAAGGLVYVAGELHTADLFAGSQPDVDTSWLRILPVVSEIGLFQSEIDLRASAREMWSFELSPEGLSDSIFRFAAETPRNREILASLPGMYWHYPVTRAKAGATVLARHGDPRMRNQFGRHVLMAMQRYGPGRTVFIGFDSTYRWRYLHEEYFDGFWARLIDRVGRGKVLGGRYPFTLMTDKAAYSTGENVVIRAKLVPTDDSNPVSQLRAEIEPPDEPPQPIEFEPAAGQQDILQASFVATDPGAYTLRAVPAGVGAESDSAVRAATLNFRVDPPKSELDNPKLNRALLDDIAKATGGKVFTLIDAKRIPDAFKIHEVERVLEYRDELWDAPIFFGGIVLLLTLEWVLRKKHRMA